MDSNNNKRKNDNQFSQSFAGIKRYGCSQDNCSCQSFFIKLNSTDNLNDAYCLNCNHIAFDHLTSPSLQKSPDSSSPSSSTSSSSTIINNNINNNDTFNSKSSRLTNQQMKQLRLEEKQKLKQDKPEKIKNQRQEKQQQSLRNNNNSGKNNRNININNDNNRINTNELLPSTSNEEILFWKCYRNKFIRTTIFSNFTKYDDYDQIFSVSKLVSSTSFTNGFEILKDKLKSNSFLQFKTLGINDEMNNIFKNVKEKSLENIQFYQRLIRLCYQAFKDNKGDAVQTAMGNSNYLVFKLLFKTFEMEPYVVSSFVQAYYTAIQNIPLYDYDYFRIIKYFVEKYNSLQFFFSFSLDNQLLKQLGQLKVKQLIKLVQFIIKYSNKFINLNTSVIINPKVYQFTNDELNSKVIQVLLKHKNSNSSDDDNWVYQVCKRLLSNEFNILKEFEQEIANCQYQNEKSSNKFNQDPLLAFEYYYYQYLNLDQFYLSQNHHYFYLLRNYTIDLLISKNNQSFINRIESLIKLNSKSLFNSLIGGIKEFHYILSKIKSIDTLEFYNRNYSSTIFDIKNCKFSWQWVSSLTVLKHYEELMNQNGLKFEIDKSMMSLEQQVNYPNTERELILEILIRASQNPKYYDIKKIETSTNVYGAKTLTTNFDIECIYSYLNKYLQDGKESVVVSLLENFEFEKFKSCPTTNLYYSISYRKVSRFICWILNNYSEFDISVGSTPNRVGLKVPLNQIFKNSSNSNSNNNNNPIDRVVFVFSLELPLFFYLIKKYQDMLDLYKIYDPRRYSFYQELPICFSRVDFIDFLINNENDLGINYYLMYAAYEGDLFIFNYLKSNYEFLFDHLNEIFLTPRDKYQIVDNALKRVGVHPNYLEIIKLFNYAGIENHQIVKLNKKTQHYVWIFKPKNISSHKLNKKKETRIQKSLSKSINQ